MTYTNAMRAFDFLRHAQQDSAEQFTRVFPAPFLVASIPQAAGRDDYFTALRPGSRASDPPLTATSRIPPGAEVFAVQKRGERNPYTAMVTIGRAENCDIVLPFSGISKFHAYIELSRAAEDRYSLCDAGSRNGTRLNGQRLVAKQPAELATRDNIGLGAEVSLVFYLPLSFWSALRGSEPPPAPSAL